MARYFTRQTAPAPDDPILRPYSYDEGPDYPKGRRSGETVSAFIRRKQREELAAGCRNIFGPVNTKYSLAADRARRKAEVQRRMFLGNGGMQCDYSHDPWSRYEAAMKAKRDAAAGATAPAPKPAAAPPARPARDPLSVARQRIEELATMVNTLDRLNGGNGRKVRAEDYLEGVA